MLVYLYFWGILIGGVGLAIYQKIEEKKEKENQRRIREAREYNARMERLEAEDRRRAQEKARRQRQKELEEVRIADRCARCERAVPVISPAEAPSMHRFKKVYTQGTADVIEIWADTETGVNYVFRRAGNASGLTPLLDKEGKPVSSPEAFS